MSKECQVKEAEECRQFVLKENSKCQYLMWQSKNMNKEEFCPHKSRVSQCDQNLPHYFFVSCMHMSEGLQVPVLRGTSTTECMQLINTNQIHEFQF